MVKSNKNKINSEVRGNTELDLLLRVGAILDSTLDLREVISPVIDELIDHLNLEYAFLTLLSRQTDDIIIEVARGLSPTEARRGKYKLGEGITGKVALSGKASIVPKTSESSIFLNRTKKKSLQDHSFICVPINIGNETVGTLSSSCLYDADRNLDEDVRILTIISSMMGQAVKLRRLAQEERERLEDENERLRAELKTRFRPANIIGNSHEMQLVYNQIAQVSKSTANVLILGDTGTGKELVAHAVHYNSDRADKPFITAHCAALPENIIESELFGHVKGAFTGANTDKKGRFELAHGGTLFLDEIGEIPPSIQIKLLRVLQEREFERVGGTDTIKVNVRLIAATNKDLLAMSTDGSFREDLYYRLNVFPVNVPPLNKRKSDILQLADFFLERYSKENGKQINRLSSAAIDMIYAYHWPGNVRELENAIERAVVVAEADVVYPHHLPPSLQTAQTSGSYSGGSIKEMVEAYERDLIIDSLKSTRGNMAASARALGATPRILGYKVHNYGIDPKQYSP